MRTIGKDLPVPANAGVYIGLRLSSVASRQCFSAACTRIDQSFFLQIVDDIVINVAMSALIINLAVPMQAKSLQGFQDDVGGTCYVSGGIEIVNAQLPPALLRSRLKKAGKRRIQGTEV